MKLINRCKLHKLHEHQQRGVDSYKFAGHLPSENIITVQLGEVEGYLLSSGWNNTFVF